MPHSCIGLFCEDIREEVSGAHTLVGVMPDNVNVERPPNAPPGSAPMFPKIGMYLRVALDATNRPTGSVTGRVTIPGLPSISLGVVEADTIEGAYKDAEKIGNPIVGLIFKGVLGPLRLKESGVAKMYAEIEGKEIVSAVLNIQIEEAR